MAHFLAFLIIILLPTLALTTSKFDGVRVELTRIDAHLNLTKAERISRSLQRAAHRSAKYCHRNRDVTTPLYHYGGEYIIDMKIGTPLQQISGIVDTGSDVIWTQCASCKHCPIQPTPKYDPSKSHSFTKLHTCFAPYNNCTYDLHYGSGNMGGSIASETFMLGSPIQIKKILVFGCTTFVNFTDSSTDFSNSTGLVGIGRGPYSLITQLGAKKFSYCVNPDYESTSPLFIGSSAKLQGGHVKSTPFNISKPYLVDDIHYNLNLRGISVGKKLLAIPPEVFLLDPIEGRGGFIIDSGSTFTNLVPIAYNAVIKAIKSFTILPLANSSSYDLCFKVHSLPLPPMPNLTFHLQGADLVLPKENYMQFVEEDETKKYCLAMQSNVVSILGNYQQQNIHFLYDVEKEVLSFKPQECSEL